MKNAQTNESERRKAARERKRRVAERTALPDAANGSIQIRIGPSLLIGGTDTGHYEWFLIPDRPLKNSEGRYPPREIVVRLRRALGLYTLTAYHNLLAIPKTTTAAKDALRQVAPLDVDRLLGEGRTRLSMDTVYRLEEQLRDLSRSRIAMLKSVGAKVPENVKSKRIDAELSAVKLISHAYSRARALLSAAEQAQRRGAKSRPEAGGQTIIRLIDATSWNEIQDSFGRHFRNLNAEELYHVAVYADINPATLWPQYISRFTQLFEIARFIGRIDRGMAARLKPDHLKLLDDILNDMFGPFNDARDALILETRAKLAIHFDEDALRRAVRRSRTTSGDLVVPGKDEQERRRGDWDDL
jgi:hypothetical protein